jgi:hypothetical protein
MRVEVRCCCDPGKLLGWIELAGRAHVAEGERFTFLLQPVNDMSPYLEAALRRTVDAEVLTLPVDYWSKWIATLDGAPPTLEDGLALKSNDTPIEQLRRILGFEEAL